MSLLEVDPWFRAATIPTAAQALLFCLPHAGGTAHAMRPLVQAADQRLSVQPVLLPGRERRLGEPAVIDVDAVTDAMLRRAAGRPFALFGHSMGARVAFDVTRELRRRGGALPLVLVVAGARPPDAVDDELIAAAALPEGQFLEHLVRLGGLAPALVADAELRELVLPAVRADFRWLAAYRYAVEPPLDVAILAFAGADDPVAGLERMHGWARQTTRGFSVHTVAGGHFLLAEAARAVLAAVERTVWGTPSGVDR